MEQYIHRLVATALYLRPDVILVFCGPGTGGDECIIVRQVFLVLGYFGGLVGSGGRFLDRTPNAMEAEATRQTSFLRSAAVSFVAEGQMIYTVEVYECASLFYFIIILSFPCATRAQEGEEEGAATWRAHPRRGDRRFAPGCPRHGRKCAVAINGYRRCGWDCSLRALDG